MEAFNGNIEMTEYLWSRLGDNLIHTSGLPGAETVKESRHAHMHRIKQLFNRHPSWTVHASNPSSIVDEENGKATVFATSTFSGYMDGIVRERVHRSKWLCIDRRWKLVEHSVLIGGGLHPS